VTHLQRGCRDASFNVPAITNCLPVRLALTAGEAHDNRLKQTPIPLEVGDNACWPTVAMTQTGSEF
jgi:hypothetical protein